MQPNDFCPIYSRLIYSAIYYSLLTVINNTTSKAQEKEIFKYCCTEC